MRILAQLAVVAGALLIMAALVLFVVGIWTVGPDSGRYVGTGFLLGLPGFLLTLAGSCWLDLNPRGRR